MHVRRALLLLAIVLAGAALAAAASQAPRRTETEAVRPAPSLREPARLRIRSNGPPRRLRLQAGQSATLTVSAREAGAVEVDRLGLLSPVDERTPAVFPLRVERAGRYPITFVPSASGDRRRLGTLVVDGERSAARR
jgi:hypothetical protein